MKVRRAPEKEKISLRALRVCCAEHGRSDVPGARQPAIGVGASINSDCLSCRGCQDLYELGRVGMGSQMQIRERHELDLR